MKRKTVLVVDDEMEIIDFLESFLTRFHINVIKAKNGREALDFYLRHNPDCVFLDIQLPDKDGITLLKEFKKLTASLKVIMITGKDDKTFQEKAEQYGAVDYITKPLDLGELSRKIKKYII